MENGSRMTESVWDYPRPPRVEQSEELVVVRLQGAPLAESRRALRVLETSHPPVYYLPFEDVRMGLLRPGAGSSWCEYKGRAVYWDAPGAPGVGWSYPDPSTGFQALREHIAFYPQAVQASVDGEPVRAQEGGFYGGWITSRVRGPFKGGPGTSRW